MIDQMLRHAEINVEIVSVAILTLVTKSSSFPFQS